MNTTVPQLTHRPPRAAAPSPIAACRRGSASSDRPTWGELFVETGAMIGAPAFFGPPISFVLGPWLFLVLLAIAPAAFLITLVLVALVTAGFLVALAALVASPYLLVRRWRTRHASRPRRAARQRRRFAPAVPDSAPHPGRAGRLAAPAVGGPRTR